MQTGEVRNETPPLTRKTLNRWFIAVMVLFFTRGLFFSTWSANGPRIQDNLHLDLAALGWYVACLSAGSVTGVIVSERIVARVGSRNFSLIAYVILGVAFIFLGLNVGWENTPLSYVITVILGFPFGAADYNNNLEAAKIDYASGKNRVPALHGGFSLGVVLGASLVGLAINMGIGIAPGFISIGGIVMTASVIAAFFIADVRQPAGEHISPASPSQIAMPESTPRLSLEKRVKQRTIWNESRSRHIGFVGFAFVFVEGVGAAWIPIALVQLGFTLADAALGYTLFSVGFVIVRFAGGPIADKIGRSNVIFYSAIVAALGIGVFMATPLIHVPLLGALLWGIGGAIGLAMCVAAFGDDPARVSSRMSFLWTLVYAANLAVGPIIGVMSSIVGLVWALVIPLVLIIAAATLKGALNPPPELAVTKQI